MCTTQHATKKSPTLTFRPRRWHSTIQWNETNRMPPPMLMSAHQRWCLLRKSLASNPSTSFTITWLSRWAASWPPSAASFSSASLTTRPPYQRNSNSAPKSWQSWKNAVASLKKLRGFAGAYSSDSNAYKFVRFTIAAGKRMFKRSASIESNIRLNAGTSATSSAYASPNASNWRLNWASNVAFVHSISEGLNAAAVNFRVPLAAGVRRLRSSQSTVAMLCVRWAHMAVMRSDGCAVRPAMQTKVRWAVRRVFFLWSVGLLKVCLPFYYGEFRNKTE